MYKKLKDQNFQLHIPHVKIMQNFKATCLCCHHAITWSVK